MADNDFAGQVAAHVLAVTRAKRPGLGWDKRTWFLNVCDIATALDVDASSVLTALRKAEDRGLVRLHGDPVHAVTLNEAHPDHVGRRA